MDTEETPQVEEAPTEENRARLTPSMRRVLWVVGALAALGLAGALWLSMAGAGMFGATAGSAGAGSASAPTPSGGAPPADAAPTQGPIPGATPEAGSEVPPPEQTAPTEGGLPPVPAPVPLVDSPLPRSASASGSLVKGYPSDLMGPTDGADVVSSSIATQGARMQVTLVARTDASPDDVRAHYRALWAGLGLADAGPAAGSDTSYSDPLSSLTLAFSPASGTGTLYTVTGVFRSS